MGAITEYYVDPSLTSDTGDGSVGTPWGRASGSVVQYALTTGITRDATNGDRINIKAGTDDVLTATLDIATYGTPTAVAPLIFQGYTAAADDRGIGGIDGDGTYSIVTSGSDYMGFADLHLHNSGSNAILAIDRYTYIFNCELNKADNRAIDIDAGSYVIGCYIHDVDIGVATRGSVLVYQNYIATGPTYDLSIGINNSVSGVSIIIENIILGVAATVGIRASGGAHVIKNSVYCPGGTDNGIEVAANNALIASVLNNAVEGCNGVNGVGFDFTENTGVSVQVFAGNIVGGDCSTSVNAPGDKWWSLLESVVDAGSDGLFADPANDDFTPEATVTDMDVTIPGAIGGTEGP